MGGFVKSFNVPIDYVLYELSYTNLIMYNSILPSYDFDKDEKKGKRKKADGNRYNMDDKENKHLISDIVNGRID